MATHDEKGDVINNVLCLKPKRKFSKRKDGKEPIWVRLSKMQRDYTFSINKDLVSSVLHTI